jgi:dienelactone hydrolase
MFEYFDSNYAWNLTAISLMDEIGTVTQPCEVFASVKAVEDQPIAVSGAAWYDAMVEMAERMEALAEADLAAGNEFTASRKFHRAATYYSRADRIIPHDDPRQLVAYRRMLTDYRKARELGRDGVEFVEIPYRDGFMPALLIRASNGTETPPIVIHIQGFDSIKETQFPMLQEYRRRSLSLLIVDQPGAGGALRLHGLTARYDSEDYVATIVDWITARADIATDRIGLCGLSMGGYFAPRAAAFEPRVKAVASWGALHNAIEIAVPASPDSEASAPSVPSPLDHARWVFGAATIDELAEVFTKMDLDGVVEQIVCPLLVMHGELDRQIPVAHATRTFERATAADKTLKIFTASEGGAEHCQVDNRAIAADYVSDWFASRL